MQVLRQLSDCERAPRMFAVLDEACSGMDEGMARCVFGFAIKTLRATGHCVIVTSHIPALQQLCHKTIELRDGRWEL